MTSIMHNDQREAKVIDKDFTETQSPVSVGPKSSIASSQVQLHVVSPPLVQQSDISESLSPRLLARRKDSEETVLWSRNEWAENIKVDLEATMAKFSLRVQEFEKTASESQHAKLSEAEDAFQLVLREAREKQEVRYSKQSEETLGWREKLPGRLATFCETAHHYQKVLDVLNSQAPEYTTAIWGAIKILLIASVNHEKLKEGVMTHLEEIGHQFGRMRAIVELQPSEQMTECVTMTYKKFVKFLKKAVKYYNQKRPWRALNSVVRPWEIRFQGIVDEIKESITRIEQLATVGHLVLSSKIYQMTEEIACNQRVLARRQSVTYQKLIQGRLAVEEMSGIMQDVLTTDKNIEKFMEKMLLSAESRQRRLEHGDQTASSRGQVQESGVEHLTSIEAPKKMREIQEKKEDWLSYYCRPENKARIFRDEVFPDLYKMDGDIGGMCQLYQDHSVLNLTRMPNLRQRPDVMSWIETSSSEFLWIDGFADNQKPDWTSRFSLEIATAADSYDSITCLHHYCSEVANMAELRNPETVLQSMLSQLIDRHFRQFSWTLCQRHDLNRFRFADANDDLFELWKLFQDCIEISQAPCIYVILDNIDTLWAHTCNEPKGVEKFCVLISGFERLAQSSGTLCKVLVTSRVPNALEHFTHMSKGPSSNARIKIMKIPSRMQEGMKSTRAPIKRIHRVPLHKSSVRRPVSNVASILATPQESEEESAIDSGEEHGSEDVEDIEEDPFPIVDDYEKFLEASESDLERSTGSVGQMDDEESHTEDENEDMMDSVDKLLTRDLIMSDQEGSGEESDYSSKMVVGEDSHPGPIEHSDDSDGYGTPVEL